MVEANKTGAMSIRRLLIMFSYKKVTKRIGVMPLALSMEASSIIYGGSQFFDIPQGNY